MVWLELCTLLSSQACFLWSPYRRRRLSTRVLLPSAYRPASLLQLQSLLARLPPMRALACDQDDHRHLNHFRPHLAKCQPTCVFRLWSTHRADLPSTQALPKPSTTLVLRLWLFRKWVIRKIHRALCCQFPQNHGQFRARPHSWP